MKLVTLLEDMIIAGVPHGPDSDPILMDDEPAGALRDADQATIAEPDGLDMHTVDELREIAANEEAPLNGATRKADIAAAIREHRAAPQPPLEG